MTRRGDPERIYQAHRAGVFMRLVSAERLDQLEAEHLIARWEREAGSVGLELSAAGYWDHAWLWIAEQRSARNVP